MLDSMIRIDALVDKVVTMGQTAVAITDHGTLAGHVKFTDACRKKGVKPILGCEFYITDDRMRRDYVKGESAYAHLIVLAKNDIGYRNMMALSTESFMTGFYRKPRIDHALLAKHAEGLIVTSACIGGDIAIHVKGGLDSEGGGKVAYDPALALAKAAWYQAIFGEDFYCELQSYGRPYQEAVNDWYRKNFPASQIVATADCHYLDAADADTHDTLLCCGTQSVKTDPDRWRFVSDQFYLKSEAEMLEVFEPSEVSNTQIVADKIDFELPLRKQFYMPELPADIVADATPEQVFRRECIAGLARRLATSKIVDDGSYVARLEHEIEIFVRAGFVGYALLLWDLMKFAERENIFTGDGRGSGAGSLVLYTLGITKVDPISRDLPFERFINAGRLENFAPPDVDLDFPQTRRGEVLDYLRERYGADRVCQIGTYATLGAPALIRKLATPLGIPMSTVARLTAILPGGDGTVQGSGAAGESAGATLSDVCEAMPAFKKIVDSMGVSGTKLVAYAGKLQKLGSHASKHASGVLITDRPVSDLVPLMVAGESVLAQFDMSDVEAMGLVKFDILGIKTLDVLAYVQDRVRADIDPDFDFQNVNLDDPAAYDLLANGKTVGIFQAEGGGMGRLIPQTRPRTVEHLSALSSLCRPGPMLAGITDTYVKRIRGEESVTYQIPQLEPLLARNFGVITYQEDVMNIAHVLAGYTLSEADDLRKIMGKKQTSKIPAQREKFISGMERVSNVDAKRAGKLFDEISKMAEYVFNRSHSMAYSYLTAKCAFAKAHFPAYFMAGAMTSEVRGDGAQLPWLLQDLRYLGCTIRLPDINESSEAYTATDANTVLVGLLGIRDVGPAAVETILEERLARGPFASRRDFMERVGLAVRVEGGFDFGDMGTPVKRKASDPKRDPKYRAITSKTVSALEDSGAFDALDVRTRLLTAERLMQELDLFGFFISGHPCERYRRDWKDVDGLSTLAEIETDFRTEQVVRYSQNGRYKVAAFKEHRTRAIVSKVEKKKSKASGSVMVFVDIEDETGTSKIMLGQKDLAKFGDIEIAKGNLLDLIGRKRHEDNWVGYFQPEHLKVMLT